MLNKVFTIWRDEVPKDNVMTSRIVIAVVRGG